MVFLYGGRYRRASEMARNISLGILFHPKILFMKPSPKLSARLSW